MFFIPGFVIAILTFPGVMVHEAGHKLFCHITGVPVYETCYFRVGNPAGYVIHGPVYSYGAAFVISVAPLIVNTATALFIFSIATNVSSPLAVWALLWLGISIGMHSFPSSGDADNLWHESKDTVSAKHGMWALLAVFGFPLVILIKAANVLSIIWFDLFYALALFGLATSVFGAIPLTGPVSSPPSHSVPLTAPDDSFVAWDDSTSWTDWTTITISGSVTNTHDKWSIEDITIEIEKLDKYNKTIGKSAVSVSPSTIPPGGKGTYYKKLIVSSSCEDVNLGLYWRWVPP